MKFRIKKEVFYEAVACASKAAAQRTPINILTAIKIEVTKDKIILTSCNSDFMLKFSIYPNKPKTSDNKDKSLSSFYVEEEGTVVVSKVLGDIIKKLPEEFIEILVEDGSQALIKSGHVRFSLNCLNSEDFVTYTKTPALHSFSITSLELKRIIKKVVFAAADDAQNNRIYLTGVLISFEDGFLKLIATDTHRLSLQKLALNIETSDFFLKDVVIPAKSLNELAKMLPDDQEVFFSFSNNQVVFKTATLEFFSRIIEDKYPDLNYVIDIPFSTKFEVSRRLFIEAMDRAALLSKDASEGVIECKITKDKFIINSYAEGLGGFYEEIDIICEGKEMMIAFDVRYMLDALRSLDDEDIVLCFSSPVKPIKVYGKTEDSNNVHIVVPVLTKCSVKQGA